MLKKFGRMVINNFGLKVLGVVFAIFLWLVIVNTEDLDKSATFTIPVEIVNADYLTEEGKTYEVLDNTDIISFTVEGKRSIVETLTEDDFRAVANMRYIDDSMSMVPITLTATGYSNQLDITTRQSYLMVDVENLVTREFEISVVADGTPAGNYFVASTEATPSVVTVTGAQSLVDEVDSAQTSIDVSGAEETLSSTETVLLLNENGVVVDEEDLTVDTTEAEVTATIYMEKTVPVTFEVQGEPAENYWFGDPECDVDSITIQGPPDVISEIEEITLTSRQLNVTGKDSDITAVVQISNSLPAGVALAEDEPEAVTVTLPIGPAVTAEVETPARNISVTGLADDLTLTITEDPIPVTLTGLEEDVSSVNGNRLSGTIDASGLDAGSYIITTALDSDDNYKAEAEISVTIEASDTSEE
ncbi:MAG: hypothetical protein LIO56_03090 [Lachnospiraceae bacterium]|nr:hypothetical protein [Lachnospiraceae bacterium]